MTTDRYSVCSRGKQDLQKNVASNYKQNGTVIENKGSCKPSQCSSYIALFSISIRRTMRATL